MRRIPKRINIYRGIVIKRCYGGNIPRISGTLASNPQRYHLSRRRRREVATPVLRGPQTIWSVELSLNWSPGDIKQSRFVSRRREPPEFSTIYRTQNIQPKGGTMVESMPLRFSIKSDSSDKTWREQTAKQKRKAPGYPQKWRDALGYS